MKKIVEAKDSDLSKNIWQNIEAKYNIIIRSDIKEFLELNSGGDPVKSMIKTKDGDHEVRKILSLQKNNKYYSFEKYASEFLEKTHEKIIPVAVDSGGNYYCVNNETGKVYFWFADDDLYYLVADSLDEFCSQ